MDKLNCWEFKKCGREPDGENVDELGVCTAATFEQADGFLGGKNGGRACAFIEGTLCSGEIHGTFRDKMKDCVNCSFFNHLHEEHFRDFHPPGFVHYVRNRHATAGND